MTYSIDPAGTCSGCANNTLMAHVDTTHSGVLYSCTYSGCRITYADEAWQKWVEVTYPTVSG